MKKFVVLVFMSMSAMQGAQQKPTVTTHYHGNAWAVKCSIEDDKGFATGVEGFDLINGQKKTVEFMGKIKNIMAGIKGNFLNTVCRKSLTDTERQALKAAGSCILIQDDVLSKQLKFTVTDEQSVQAAIKLALMHKREYKKNQVKKDAEFVF